MTDDQADIEVLEDLRATVEELARRMGAGFREDLAQIRAIATSVAERDLTDDVKALRAEVAALADRDATQPVLEELAAVRDELQRVASADAVSGVRADLAPVHAALDRIAARLDDDSGRSQVLSRFQAIEAKLDAVAAADGNQAMAARIDELAARFDGLATGEQVKRLAGDLRAHLADALGGLDGDALYAELIGLRSQLGGERGTVVEQIQDHLADVASGEVVGALWDEVRSLRAVVDAAATGPDTDGADVSEVLESLATLRSEVEGIGAAVASAAEPSADPAVAGMRQDVQALVDEVRALSDAVATLERDIALPSEPAPGATPAGEADVQLSALTEELATLRTELAEGLVVEPSDALSASLDALRVEVDSLHVTLGQLRNGLAQPAPEASAPSADALATLFDELAAVRSGVDGVRDRLEDGLVLEQEEPGTAGAPAVEVEVLVDQIAALRDLVSSEVDGLRQAVAAPVDPAVVEDLKDEIRAAGAVADEVVDALREELKALRRRIAVKTSEKVLDDDQLAQIADAVAARLAQDPAPPT